MGPGVGISNRISGDAEAACPGTTHLSLAIISLVSGHRWKVDLEGLEVAPSTTQAGAPGLPLPELFPPELFP